MTSYKLPEFQKLNTQNLRFLKQGTISRYDCGYWNQKDNLLNIRGSIVFVGCVHCTLKVKDIFCNDIKALWRERWKQQRNRTTFSSVLWTPWYKNPKNFKASRNTVLKISHKYLRHFIRDFFVGTWKTRKTNFNFIFSSHKIPWLFKSHGWCHWNSQTAMVDPVFRRGRTNSKGGGPTYL